MAVEVLVWVRNVPERTGRRRGQIIHAQDAATAKWGKKEKLPDFVVLKINGLDLDDVKPLLEDYHSEEGWFLRRRRRLNFDSIPSALRTQILSQDKTEINAVTFAGVSHDDWAEAKFRFDSNDPDWPPRELVS